MRVLGIVALGATLSTSVHADVFDDKRCILAAAEKLPAIQGLIIASSRAKQMPVEMQPAWQLQRDRYLGFLTTRQPKAKPADVNAMVVELDTKAAAIDATHLFACFFAASTPPIVYAVGIVR
jgi:hypothetical protein